MFLETAHRIGIDVARAALWEGGACTWTIHIPPRGENAGAPPAVRAAGPALYAGSAGIALFLAELFRLTGDAQAARTARGALRHALGEAERMPENAFGFHNGRVGIAYAAVRAAQALEDGELADAAARVLGPLAGREGQDRALDVVGGAAGAIPVLLGMAGVPGLEPMRDVAVRLGEHLLRVREPEPGGWSWRGAGPVHVRNLTGLGHGASGIGHALLELFQATGDGRFLYAGEQAFAYERQFFDAATGNWRDLRHPELARYAGRMDELRARLAAGETLPPLRPSGMVAWCYGAAGIGLARLRAYETLRRDVYRAEAEAAVRTTLDSFQALHAQRSAASVSLCHGAAGNAETLALAARVLGRPELLDRARELAAAAWDAYDGPGGARHDRPPERGLMLGEAGTGHAFLRLHGAEVPSVLLVTAPVPPRAASGEAARTAGPPRRESVDVWFGRAVRVWERVRGRPWTPAAEPWTPDAADAYRRLRADVDAEPDAELRERLDDALRPEEARWQAAVGITDFAARFVEGLLRPAPAGVAWDQARFRLAPHARLVECGWDWDAWLRAGGADGPARRTTRFAVHEAGTRAHLQPLAPLAALVLDALERPGSAAEAAERVAQAAGAPSSEASALSANVRRQIQQLYAAGLIDLA